MDFCGKKDARKESHLVSVSINFEIFLYRGRSEIVLPIYKCAMLRDLGHENPDFILSHSWVFWLNEKIVQYHQKCVSNFLRR